MRFSILVASTLAASVVVLANADAHAQAAGAPFGKAGELAISWDQPIGSATVGSTVGGLGGVGPVLAATSPGSLSPISFEYTTAGDAGSFTLFNLAPAADVFVIDNLSVGGQVLLGFGSYSPPRNAPSQSITLYGIGPQIGYNIAISDLVSLWPKLNFGFTGVSLGNNGGSGNAGTLGIYVPFLFHVAPHFYLGIGPNLSTELFGNVSPPAPAPSQSVANKPTTFGAMATFGGWVFGD
jgi:hypothetical protein